jgi:hypothetical protein
MLRLGLPKEWGRPFLKLKNDQKIFIEKVYGKYVVEYKKDDKMIKLNNCTLDQLADIIIEEGK